MSFQVWAGRLNPESVHYVVHQKYFVAKFPEIKFDWLYLRRIGARHQPVRSTLYHAIIGSIYSHGKIHPFASANENCVFMLVTNLARPTWLLENCDRKIAKFVFCKQKPGNTTENTQLQTLNRKCPSALFILKSDVCYMFAWETFPLESETLTLQKFNATRSLNVKKLEFLFDAVTVAFPRIILLTSKNSFQVVTYKIFSQHYYYTNVTNTEVLYIREKSYEPIMIGGNLLKCEEGRYVSILSICDGTKDCPENTGLDETDCECNLTSNQHNVCVNAVKKLFHYILNDTVAVVSTQLEGDAFLCNNRTNISRKLTNDLVADCGSDAEDEPHLVDVEYLKLHTSTPCQESGMLSCRRGLQMCYNIHDICVYKLNENQHMIPCRTGDHIQSCRQFECNMMFKCPEYYCIHWSCVCDGKWDCPEGFDESESSQCGDNRTCKGLFNCKNHKTCNHLGEVCDEERNCPLGEDEAFCQANKMQCPKFCQCFALTICCFNSTDPIEYQTYPYVAVFLAHSKIQTVLLTPKIFQSVKVLSVTHCNLEHVCHFLSKMSSFRKVDLSFNGIEEVMSGCFQKSVAAKVILLDNNRLSLIQEGAFSNLKNLEQIALRNNLLQSFSVNSIVDCTKLNLVALSNNSLDKVGKSAFQGLKFCVLETLNYSICCILPVETKCTAKIPWYISCAELLPKPEIKIFFFCVTIIVMILNAASICTVLFKTKELKTSQANKVTVVSVNVADLTCGAHLLVLSSAHLFYQSSFALKEDQWRSSVPCFCSFFVVLNFSLISPVVMCFLSLSRYKIVDRPVDTKFKNKNFVLKSLSAIFSGTASFSISPTIATKLLNRKLSTSLCSPFVDPTNSIFLVRPITFFVIIFQLTACIFIIGTNTKLFEKLRNTQKQLQKSKSRKLSNLPLALQLVVVTSSNVVCWIPSGVIFLVTLLKDNYSVEMLVWTTVAVTPLNSVINPLVFVVTSFRQAKK